MNAKLLATFIAGVYMLVAPALVFAQTVHASLSSFQEVPAVSSTGSGTFRAKIDEPAGAIHWQLSYTGLESDASQSHLHFGQRSVNGGVSVFLCSNLGNGPAGTQACPARSAELSGVIMASDMVGGAAAQGLSPGDFAELVAAIRRGVVYVNVHSATWPGGEIRGQLRR